MNVNRCYGCMEEITAYPCSHCGYTPGEEPGYALAPGTILNGKYLVGKVLGQGGFGITYIGWDLTLCRKVAIKEYYPAGQVVRQESSCLYWLETELAQQARESGREMFLREARKMSRVSDISQIVQVQEMFQENETAYIVMDFIEGETLKQRLTRTGPLSWQEAQEIFLPVIQAMEQVHQAGLVHRDLSPDNLMLLPDGGVKILDLGAAKDLRLNSGASSAQVAKGGYSPFEQYTQRGGSGTWSDVYAMAATMYYTLTGVLPPIATDRVEDDAMDWSLLKKRSVPANVISALQEAMRVSAKERTQTMAELYQDITGRRSSFRRRRNTSSKSWNMPVTMGVVLVFAVLAAIFLWKPGFTSGSVEETVGAELRRGAGAAFERLMGCKDLPETVKDRALHKLYAAAENILAGGDQARAAMAFSALGDYRDARERSFSLWAEVTHRDTISEGIVSVVGVTNAGTLVTAGSTFNIVRNVEDWQDLVAVSQGTGHTVGLKANGTVLAGGNDANGRCDVGTWRDIVAISAGYEHTVGLKADGTVVAVGRNDSGQCGVDSWQDCVAVSAGGAHTVGLKADGRVVAVGDNEDGQCDVSAWRDIVAVSAGEHHTLGLRADGTVVAVGGNNCGECNVDSWRDIIAISAGETHTVGLKADGTVVAVGYNGSGECNVRSWRNIVAITSGWHTEGLKADGTVVSAGDRYGTNGINKWTEIQLPN